MIGGGPSRPGSGSTMIEAMLARGAFSAGWDQLIRLWELIVMVCRFLWELLRLLSGGG
ncbi:hypothetical protein C7408_101490 [Paraburkholderia caballeronis]|nr:hypothetical protein C7408_101490 [Paraburkholderia caballeronis]TDV21400.1 hypothetical protein C7406_102300 [Paraburkholderia caballeronis]TDV33439.1 hypothetical protein C7404_101586 [Paraburkholderia caballeronis]